jgi:hypothetical protein
MLSSTWVRAIVVAAAITWAGIALAVGEELTWSMTRPLGLTMSVVVAGALAYEKWMWRWPLLNRLSGRPDLNGTWKAQQSSSFHPADGEPIECYLSITQTLSSIRVLGLYDVSNSTAMAAALSEQDDMLVLSYLFRSQKRILQQGDNPTQRGAATLVVARHPQLQLEGDYWMEHGTRGQIVTVGRARQRFHTFASARAATYV